MLQIEKFGGRTMKEKEELLKQISAYKERQEAEKKKSSEELDEELELILKALKARKGMIQDIIEVYNSCVEAGIKLSDFAPDSEALGFMQAEDKSVMIGFKGHGMMFMTNGDIISDYFLYEEKKQAEIKYIDELLYQLPDFTHDFYEFVNSAVTPKIHQNMLKNMKKSTIRLKNW